MAIKIIENILTNDEIEYIHKLIDNKNEWTPLTKYDEVNSNQEKLWFDAINIDKTKLKNYYNKIEINNLFVNECGLNVITKERQLEDSLHFDICDLSYVTYFNSDFEGGEFCYYEGDDEIIIKPKNGLTIQINNKTPHRVKPVTDGIRYSLYTFLYKKIIPKKEKTLL
jgi:predicted 2-oxoglutarate/Fe(II)-dependent dioxygenase YbiX